MNERIKELAEQVGFENGHQDRNGNSLSYELEKFAELIVRECAIIANEKEENFPQYDPNISVNWYIKKHFGVEE